MFMNNNFNIFRHYKKDFNLPNCYIKNSTCKCYKSKKNIKFNSIYPLNFIINMKKNMKKNISLLELHNNANMINFDSISNTVKRKHVKQAIKEHKQTLDIFKNFYIQKEKKIMSKNYLFFAYINNQHIKCVEYIDDVCKFEYSDCIPLIILTMSFYAHYHSLKLFENYCVNNH